jgi:hypothetical protein
MIAVMGWFARKAGEHDAEWDALADIRKLAAAVKRYRRR